MSYHGNREKYKEKLCDDAETDTAFASAGRNNDHMQVCTQNTTSRI